MVDSRDPISAGLPPHAIAVVSGKGGSGKTMVAVALARGLSLAGRNVLLIDGDFGTGGLTYYLTFREFTAARVGLSDAVTDTSAIGEILQAVAGPAQDSRWGGLVSLLPVGDQRRVDEVRKIPLKEVLSNIRSLSCGVYGFIIIDCRGGLDTDSVEVCSTCDDIFMVVETDATAIRASQHLIETLSDVGLKRKIAGFILNKVIDDPTSLARSGSSFFSSKYLGAIPFDIEATRCYIQGSLPQDSSLFARHVFAILAKSPFDIPEYSDMRILAGSEFGSVSLRDPRAVRGGTFIALTAVYLAVIFAFQQFDPAFSQRSGISEKYLNYSVVAGLSLLVLAGLSEKLKTLIGSAFNSYSRILRRVFRMVGL